MLNKKIKNIGIYAHVDAGKTTLTEQLLFHAGVIRSAGSVDAGDTHTDTMDLERERGISIMSAPISYDYGGEKINIIDTPGHVDFIAEVERSMLVLDAAILVISAKESVQSHTQLLFQRIKKQGVPTILFINKIDRLGVNLVDVFEDISMLLTDKRLAFQKVLNEGSKSVHVGELFDADFKDCFEKLAMMDEEVLERFFEGDLETDFAINKIKKMTGMCELYPVLFGSAMHGIGIESCLDAVHQIFDSREFDPWGDLGGIVFKVRRSHVKTKESYLKLTSGSLATRELIGLDKITKIEAFINGKIVSVDRVYAGDIAIVHGLSHYKVGDTFGSLSLIKQDSFVIPTLKVKIIPQKSSERRVLLDALEILSEADPYLEYQLNLYNEDIYLKLFGYIQMEIIAEILYREFGLAITYKDPMTIYMETIKKSAEYEVGMYEDGLPFHAGLGFRITPLALGSGIVYESLITTGYLKQPFQNAIKEGVFEYLDQGLYGWELTDMKITLFSFVFNSVSSSPKDYRDLAPLILFEAIKRSETNLLWPMNEFELTVPLDQIGKAISDLAKMKASFNEPTIKDNKYYLTGVLPAENTKNYSLDVHAYTSGKGYFYTKFAGYEPAPDDLIKVREPFKLDPSNRAIYLMGKSRVV